MKSVIYVNNQLPSYCFSAIETNTALVAGITVALPSPHPPLHLLSAYLPPNQAQTMSSLTPILSALRPDPILLGMGSNLHHTLWNPPSYAHTHREADDLIARMNDAGLLLQLETYISNQSRNQPTIVDLQWHTPECYEWATVCRTESDFDHSHFSDHVAITTELDLPASPLADPTP